MARLEGFEPPTNGFGSHYSIRLSYRRVLRAVRHADVGRRPRIVTEFRRAGSRGCGGARVPRGAP